MPKFRKKPVVIEANIFEWGMEAGVIKYNSYIPKDSEGYPEEMKSEKYPGYLKRYEQELSERGFGRDDWRPYIITIHDGQRVIIGQGDYIISEPDGVHFYPCKPEIFEETYEPIN